ncbi:MAG: hypothetical protein ACOY3Y_18335, partial [Acidobacteriota bacterium]
MDRRLKNGCVAIAAAPLLFAVAPIAALVRRAAVRRRGMSVLARVSRTTTAGVPGVATLVGVPWSRLNEVSEAMARAAAEVAATIDSHIGVATGRDGEEPALFTLAPRRDLVADRFRRDMRAGPAHAAPSLWLALFRGTFLAGVIDPYAPAELTGRCAARLVADERCRFAAAVRRRDAVEEVEFQVEVYGSAEDVREFLRASRVELSGLPGWESRRNAPPPRPR